MAAQVVVPQLGESVVEARVARWLKKEGEAIAVGDPLVELETEKIDLEVNADQAGVLAKILRQEGEDVKVGEQLALIEAGAGARRRARALPQTDAPASRDASAARGDHASRRRGRPPAPRTAPRSTPAARKAAEVHQVDMAQVQGSGDAGRVMRRDVEAAATPASRAAPAPAPAAAKPAPAPGAPRRARPSRRAAAPRNACGCPSAA